MFRRITIGVLTAMLAFAPAQARLVRLQSGQNKNGKPERGKAEQGKADKAPQEGSCDIRQ